MTQPTDPVKRVLAHAKEFSASTKRAVTARHYAIGLFLYDYIDFTRVKWFVAIKFREKIAKPVAAWLITSYTIIVEVNR